MLRGAGRCFVGRKEDRESRDFVRHELPLQALPAHQLGLAFRRQPFSSWRSVMMQPGAIAFTRILEGPKSRG